MCSILGNLLYFLCTLNGTAIILIIWPFKLKVYIIGDSWLFLPSQSPSNKCGGNCQRSLGFGFRLKIEASNANMTLPDSSILNWWYADERQWILVSCKSRLFVDYSINSGVIAVSVRFWTDATNMPSTENFMVFHYKNTVQMMRYI